MQDETVYPALETIALEMQAGLILFAHTGQWNQVRLDERTFINLGPLLSREPESGPLLDMAIISAGESAPGIERCTWPFQE